MLVRIEGVSGDPLRCKITSSAGPAEVTWRGESAVEIGGEVDVELNIDVALRWQRDGLLVGEGGDCSLRAQFEAPGASGETLIVRWGGEGIGAIELAPGERMPSDGERFVVEQAAVSAWPTGV